MGNSDVQEWSVQCNTEGKYGQILVVIVVYLQIWGFEKNRLYKYFQCFHPVCKYCMLY